MVGWRRVLGEDDDEEGSREGGRGSAMEMQIASLSPVARL